MQAAPPHRGRATCPPSQLSEDHDGFDAALCLLERLRTDSATVSAPRITIIAAHPDDEVIGVGGQLSRLRAVSLVHVTDGAPRDMRDAVAAGFATRHDYACARRRELADALALAGIAPDQMHAIGIADQEASLQLAELSQSLAGYLQRIGAELIITHPYEGGHPDHDATAFAVHAACRLLDRRGLAPPAIVEMTSYHNRGGAMAMFAFLPAEGRPVVTLRLNEAQRELKRRMIDRFASQKSVLAPFPLALERLRPAPAYDFTRPPHEGPLFYEMHPWGMTGIRWRDLAREALAALRMGEASCA